MSNFNSIDGKTFYQNKMDSILPRTENAVDSYRASNTRVIDASKAAKFAAMIAATKGAK